MQYLYGYDEITFSSLFVFRITKTKWFFFSAFINAENVKLDSIVEIADIVLLLTFKKKKKKPRRNYNANTQRVVII